MATWTSAGVRSLACVANDHFVAEGVGHDAVAVAPEHVLRGHQHRGAGVRGALDRGVAVFDILMDRDRRTGRRLGRRRLAAAELRNVVDQKHDAAADPNGRVHDPAPVQARGRGELPPRRRPSCRTRSRPRTGRTPGAESDPRGRLEWAGGLAIVKPPWYMGELVVSATKSSCQTRTSYQWLGSGDGRFAPARCPSLHRSRRPPRARWFLVDPPNAKPDLPAGAALGLPSRRRRGPLPLRPGHLVRTPPLTG